MRVYFWPMRLSCPVNSLPILAWWRAQLMPLMVMTASVTGIGTCSQTAAMLHPIVATSAASEL